MSCDLQSKALTGSMIIQMTDGRGSENTHPDALWRDRMSSSLDDLRTGGAQAFAPLQIKVRTN